MLVSGREAEREASDDDVQRQLGVEDGQVLSYAGSEAEAEGNEARGVGRRAGRPAREPRRVELVHVRAPRGRVVVHRQDRDQQLRALRDFVAPELHVRLRSPYRRHRRRV